MGYITYNNVLAIKSTAAVGKIPMFVEMVLNFVPVRLSLWNLKLIINILVLQKLPGILYLKYIIISNTILNNIKIRKDIETIFFVSDLDNQWHRSSGSDDAIPDRQCISGFSCLSLRFTRYDCTTWNTTGRKTGGPPVLKRKLVSNNNVAARVSNVSAAINKLDKLAEKNMNAPPDEFEHK